MGQISTNKIRTEFQQWEQNTEGKYVELHEFTPCSRNAKLLVNKTGGQDVGLTNLNTLHYKYLDCCRTEKVLPPRFQSLA